MFAALMIGDNDDLRRMPAKLVGGPSFLLLALIHDPRAFFPEGAISRPGPLPNASQNVDEGRYSVSADEFAGGLDQQNPSEEKEKGDAAEIPDDGFSILLSHTPEIYRQAAHGGFDLLVSGHTHGGQICLPGSIPITLDSVLPRHMGSGPWKHREMVGYTSVGVGTSVVPVRINCLPEITLHHLQCSA
jgi:predicted MPP superfamily phosphohydrolase